MAFTNPMHCDSTTNFFIGILKDENTLNEFAKRHPDFKDRLNFDVKIDHDSLKTDE